MSSEKNTDCLMMLEWKKYFGEFYNTNHNDKLFGKKCPDAWAIIKDTLFIIENKKNEKFDAETQVLNYICNW